MNFSHMSKILLLLVLSGVATCRFIGMPPRQASQTSIKKLADANNNFGLNLYQRLRENTDENLFFSPLSLSMAFGMLFHGARGDTAKELRSGLGYQQSGLPDDQVPVAFSRYLRQLRSPSNKGYELALANGILVGNSLPLSRSYRVDMKAVYNAPVEGVNFAADSEKVKDSVNDWVDSKTKGKIQSLLDDLSPETVMIILNAVYFKGTWKQPFDEEMTMDHAFYNNGRDVINTPMMHMSEFTFPYASLSTYSAIELPYNGNISMVILLPTERDGLPSLEASLTPSLLASTLSSLRPSPVTLSLPKFKLETSSKLNEPLQRMGMEGMFNNGANLSGISPSTALKVSEVVHKATVNVDEKGSEAAAATAIGVVAYSARLDQNWFVVDHPFVFAIVDRRSDMVMFLGRVNAL